MMRRALVILAVGLAFLGGSSLALANSDTSLQSTSVNIDLREVIADYPTPSVTNNSLFYAECPIGYSVIGGGAWQQSGGTWTNIKAMYPAQDTRRWYALMDSNGLPVRVFASCLKV
jgi:hypothetical protein